MPEAPAQLVTVDDDTEDVANLVDGLVDISGGVAFTVIAGFVLGTADARAAAVLVIPLLGIGIATRVLDTRIDVGLAGPLVSETHRQKVRSYYDLAGKEGATVVTGGFRFGITIARANWRAVCAATSARPMPSRRCTCQSSGRVSSSCMATD